MMGACTTPLVHTGYQLPPFSDGVDLLWLGLGREDAQAKLMHCLAVIEQCNAKLYSPEQLPSAPPQRKLYLQSIVDLLACNYDKVKPSLSAKQQQEGRPVEEQQQPAQENAEQQQQQTESTSSNMRTPGGFYSP